MALYAVLMLLYKIGWSETERFKLPEDYIAETSVSIIIPARNEEDNIAQCIEAIVSQNYPKELMQLIVVDDHSTDNTAPIVQEYAANNSAVTYLDLANDTDNHNNTSFKKQALSYGISNSNGELIITTDADCTMGAEWLNNIVAIYQKENAAMVVAPVDFTNNSSTVEVFQSIDFMSMQGITAATHQLKLGNMCNGANLAFTRQAYDGVNGYTGIDHIASGDDYLLMMKINKTYPGRISYLMSKQAIVYTAPQPDWKSFLCQRIRWASKSGKYDDKKMTAVLMLVYLFNLSFLFMLIVSLFDTLVFINLLGMLVCKTVVELLYLYSVAKFFNKTAQLTRFVFLQPLHIAYVISAGFMGFFGQYEWKGRSVK